MNFRKLPKEKRDKLILVLAATLVIIAGLYFLLIKHQNENLARLANKKAEVRASHHRALDAIRRAHQIEADLAKAQKELAAAEADIASGDIYSWVINTLRQFKAAYRVNIPQFSSLSPVTEVNLLPNFPYRQASLSFVGTAHYHDLGRFLADLENQFPHIRAVNLTLDLNPIATAEDQETVSFKLDLITLVKTNPS